jgi:hypothetical protein
MAGVLIPSTVVFLVGVFVCWFFYRIPPDIERALVFPMALNPFLWGTWNVVYLILRPNSRLPIGVHGAILAMLLIATGTLLAPHLHFSFVTGRRALSVLVPTAFAYYLLWRFGVESLNRRLGVSTRLERK